MRGAIRTTQVAVVLIILVTVGTLTVGAGSFSAGPLVQVSGTSPFADCGLTAAGGTLYVDSEIEPWVDVSPVDGDGDGIDGDIIAGIWQQDRWSNGGARGNVAGISFDGGSTWQQVTFPDVTECTGGDFDRASDPWLSFSPNGDLHVMHLVLDIETVAGKPGGFGPNGMMAQKIPVGAFADGSIAQSEINDPILIAFEDNGEDLHDKNSMTADPFDSNFVYAVWDFLDLPAGAAINPDRGVFGGGLGFKGAALFSRTTDGGETWSEPKVLYNPGGVNQTIGNQIVVLPDGTLVNFFNEILNFRDDDQDGQFDFNLSLKRSPDKGETWLPHGRPIRATNMRPQGVVTPDELLPVRAAAVIFDVAVDHSTGTLYAVWQDARFTGVDEIAYAESTDGGFTWTAPVKINLTPPKGNPLRQQAFVPSVAVASDGTVGVTYYDFRNDDETGELADYWIIHCHGGCSDPANWQDEVRLTDASFDIKKAPNAGGFFLGDYEGLVAAGTEFLPFFAQPHDSDPASMFFTRVGP